MWGDLLKRNSLVILIIVIFSLIIPFIIFYTIKCNENAVNASTVLNKEKTIIIDAGHGGLDGGAVGADGTQEKHLNLEIAFKLKRVLEMYGFKIIMTRDSDNSIHSDDAVSVRQQKISDIKNREKIIIDNPDAIFISIHQNKFQDTSVNGAQVFYSKNNTESKILAEAINNSLTLNIQPDNQKIIKKTGTEIYLLYHSLIPSVMVECGFISNQTELSKLKTSDYQMRLILAITQGILIYYKGC